VQPHSQSKDCHTGVEIKIISVFLYEYKVKLNQSHYSPGHPLSISGCWDSQISRKSSHESGKVVNHTHRPILPPGNIPGTHFCLDSDSIPSHCSAGNLMSMKIFNDNTRNRTRELPACTAVPQPIAPPVILCDSYFCGNERFRLDRSWQSTFCVL